jgi:FPC/CPF motif-containing protein YcgG
MTDPQFAEGIMHDMLTFQEEFGIPGDPKGKGKRFRSFVTAFAEPQPTSALHGTEMLYSLLGNMHDVNRQHYPWNEGYSNNTESPNFGFSAGESAFFIAYFHPQAYEQSRRSDVTFVVFNSHVMLEALKAEGKFAKLRDTIRSRQEEVHPYLGDHGTTNEWLQYALLSPDSETELAEQDLREKVLGVCPFR